MMDSGAPAYLRTHPLTTDRIADMQDRARNDVNKNRAVKNSLDFYLNQTMAKLEQQGQGSDLLLTKEYFQNQANQTSSIRKMQGQFGLSLIALRENKPDEAEKLLQKSKEISTQISASQVAPRSTFVFDLTLAQIALQKKNFTAAQNAALQVMKTNPSSKAAGVLLVQAYFAGGKNAEGIAWLVQKTKTQKDDVTWWNLLAQGYAQSNQPSRYHAAIAERYASEGALPAAIQQLNIAQQEGTKDFYELSEIEARRRQLEFLYIEELKDNGRLPRGN
jgi:predicted Zn-dependent protease